MTIVFCSPKGGVGKSTASLMFGAALARAGHTVALSDVDPNGTASRSAPRLGIPVVGAGTKPSILIVDTPPSLAHDATRAAITTADVAILVTGIDTAELEKIPAEISTLLGLRRARPIRTLLNRIPPLTTLAAKNLPVIRTQLAAAGIAPLHACLSSRIAYSYAHSDGWSALNSAAQTEVMSVAIEVLGLCAAS